jgi:hypothetical protein
MRSASIEVTEIPCAQRQTVRLENHHHLQNEKICAVVQPILLSFIYTYILITRSTYACLQELYVERNDIPVMRLRRLVNR